MSRDQRIGLIVLACAIGVLLAVALFGYLMGWWEPPSDESVRAALDLRVS